MLSRCVNGNQRFACTAVWSAVWSFHGTFLWHMQHSTTNLKVFWNMSKANLQAKCILPSSLLALVIDIGLPAMQLVRVWKNSHQGWTCCYPNVFRHFCIWLLKHDFNSVHSSICMYINIYIMSFLSASYPWLSSGCEVRSHVTRCWHRGWAHVCCDSFLQMARGCPSRSPPACPACHPPCPWLDTSGWSWQVERLEKSVEGFPNGVVWCSLIIELQYCTNTMGDKKLLSCNML